MISWVWNLPVAYVRIEMTSVHRRIDSARSTCSLLPRPLLLLGASWLSFLPLCTLHRYSIEPEPVLDVGL